MTNTAELEVVMKDAAEAWRDMQVVRADVGTLEMSGFPAIRLRMQSGREFDVSFGSWSCGNAVARFQAVVVIGIWGFSTRTAAIGV